MRRKKRISKELDIQILKLIQFALQDKDTQKVIYVKKMVFRLLQTEIMQMLYLLKMMVIGEYIIQILSGLSHILKVLDIVLETWLYMMVDYIRIIVMVKWYIHLIMQNSN